MPCQPREPVLQNSAEKLTPIRLGAEHAPLVAEIEKLCFDQPWSEDQCRKAFEQQAYAAFGMPGQGGLVAYISLYITGDELEVLNLAVRPEFRRRGHGRRLLFLVLQAAIKMGIQKAHLEVRESNFPAIGLYEGLGFVQCGKRPRYYANNEDALLYACNLGINGL